MDFLRRAHAFVRSLIHRIVYFFLFRPPKVNTALYEPQPIATYKPHDATYAILYFHGNSEHAWVPSQIKNLLPHVAVYAPEYPGYGNHVTQTTSEENIYAAAIGAYNRIRADGFMSSRIVVWGFSLGGGPAAYIASTYPCAGLVLDSTFASVFSILSPHVGALAQWLGVDLFPTARRLCDVSGNVAIVHSKNDWTVPVSNAHANYNQINPTSREMWTVNGHHADLVPDHVVHEVFRWVTSQ